MKKFNLLKGLAMSLLTLALCFVAFGAVKAKADISAVYDPTTDTVKVTGGSGSTVYFADLKKSGKQAVKNASSTSLSGGEATIVLDNKDDGLKIGENKTIYLYVSDVDPDTLEKPEGTAAVTIKGSTVKKVTVTLNYAKSVSGEPSVAFTATLEGKTVENPGDKFIFRSSTDGKTFDEWKSAADFTGGVLYKAVTGEDKVTYQFKYKGDTSTRDSKAVKVKVAQAAKAPKVKVDFVKGTISIKNGFDYLISSSSAEPTGDWKTILPYNKAGTASGSGAIIATSTFIPAAKPTDADSKAMFTKDKFKSLTINEALFGNADEIYMYFRKSATAKKPASLCNEDAVVIAAPAQAPQFTAVSGETDTKKKKTTFVSDLSDCEYLIVKSADLPDLSEAKWVKLGSKGIELKKSKTKVSKKEQNTLGESSYVLIRVAGVKDTSLPSRITLTQISKTTGASGETIYVWGNVTNSGN